MTTNGIRPGFTTVTPYLTVANVEALVHFLKTAFAAEETHCSRGSAGGFHYELHLADSMLMCGGGSTFPGPYRPAMLHYHVPDVDDTFQRAIHAGATAVYPVEDKPYGERQGTVKDPAGNLWSIATHDGPLTEGMRAITPYLHAEDALGLIDFVTRAFSAKQEAIYKTPEGKLMHGAAWIGNALLEFGDAPNMPCAFYLYVPDADALYRQALTAGAKVLYPPSDQPYGDRMGGVEDAWGNQWYIATNLTH